MLDAHNVVVYVSCTVRGLRKTWINDPLTINYKLEINSARWIRNLEAAFPNITFFLSCQSK